MPGLSQLVVTAVILFVGSTVLSTIGFGIGMVSMPVMLLVLHPHTAVVTLNTVAVGLEAGVVLQSKSSLRVREILPIAVSGLLGVPVGVLVLSSADPGMLRTGIAGLVIALAALSSVNWRVPMVRSPVLGLLTGCVVGMMLASSGIGSPLIALFLLARGWPRHAVRASLSFVFILTDLASVVGYGIAGLITTERLIVILIALGPVLLGLKAGGMLVDRLSERMFRLSVVTVTIATSVVVLVREAVLG